MLQVSALKKGLYSITNRHYFLVSIAVISSNITQTPDLENDLVKQGLAFITVSLNFLGIKRLTEFVRTYFISMT